MACATSMPMLNTIKAPMITDSIGNSFGRSSRKLRAPRAAQSKLNCRAAEVPRGLMIFGNMIVGLLIAQSVVSPLRRLGRHDDCRLVSA